MYRKVFVFTRSSFIQPFWTIFFSIKFTVAADKPVPLPIFLWEVSLFLSR